MFKVFVTVSHTQEYQGASYEGISENMLSIAISNIVVDMLKDIMEYDDTVEVYLIEEGNNKAKALEIKYWLDEEDFWIALQVHFNSEDAEGSCVLYREGSKIGRRRAEKALKYLEAYLDRGRHYTGVIPFPSSYRLDSEGEPMKLSFFEHLKEGKECNAVLLEIDSIKYARWAISNIEEISNCICEYILAIIEDEEV